jgi:hypothetical protein
MTQFNQADAREFAGKALREMSSIGRSWARYGLTVSKIALETSASTLQKTATMLGDLSTAFRDEERAPEQPPETAQNKPS